MIDYKHLFQRLSDLQVSQKTRISLGIGLVAFLGVGTVIADPWHRFGETGSSSSLSGSFVALQQSVTSSIQGLFSSGAPASGNILTETAQGTLAQGWLTGRDVQSIRLSLDPVVNQIMNDVVFERDATVYTGADAVSGIREMCSTNQTLCRKITFQGTYSLSQRMYLYGVTIFLVNKLDDMLTEGDNLEDVLDTISFGTGSIGESCGHTAKWCSNGVVVLVNTDKIKKHKELLETMTHEMGHVFDLGLVQWAEKTLSKQYTDDGEERFSASDWSLRYYKISWLDENNQRSGQTDADFCSQYGQENPFEDFAECFNLRNNNNDTFKYLATKSLTMQDKYNYMSSLFNGQFIFPNLQDKKSFVEQGKTLIDTSLRQ